ncbi:MAG: hypothetical protein BGN92_15240 [Sphingobacteriales bacterium 41-5]|nr:MAG: hypothetical protein BGN92_15240 [Sphingobacteriales bacterium 41-5]
MTKSEVAVFEKIIKHSYPVVHAQAYEVIRAAKPVNDIADLKKLRQLFGERAIKERHLFIAIALKYIYPNLYGAKTPFFRFEGFTGEVARLTGDHVSNTSKKIRDVLIWLHSNADDFRDKADAEFDRIFDKCEPCPGF